jgi:hypothetical protein
MLVHMTTKNDPNNRRLRALIERAGLTQAGALALFNRGLIKPYSISAWKAYLADGKAARWRRFDDALLNHAEKVFGRSK